MLFLYPKNTIDFTNNGDPIHHSYDEHVIRDDGFYLTFNLLLDKEGEYKKVKKEMIIGADTPDGRNQFRVYDVKKKNTHVEVTAVQLMYDFDNKEVNPFSVKNASGNQVITKFKNSFKSSLGQFTMDSSVTETHDFTTNDEEDDTPSHNALEVLNRITKRWDSELMLSGFDIRMIKRLGAKTDALLYEKKNISEFEDSSSVGGMATRIHATSKFTPEGAEEEVTLSVTVDSPLINEYAQIYEKSYVNNDAKTEAELIAWAKLKYSTENIDKPSRSITVATNIIDGTEINYGDDLVLKYLVHDVDEVIRCVGYDYDPIRKTYYSVTLGDWKDSFLNTVTSNIVDSTNKQFNQLKNNITYVSMSANGKNRNAYGPEPVPNPINGDQWYYYELDRPNDVELRVYQDSFWVKFDFFATKNEVEGALTEAEETKQSANDAVAKADTAIQEAGFAKVDASAAVANAATALNTAQTAAADASSALTNAGTALDRVGAVETTTSNLTTYYNELTQTVGAKADKAIVDGINRTVTTHSSQIEANAEGLLAKADKSLVDTLKGTVDSHSTQIAQTAQDVSSKAEQTSVDTLKGTVTSQGTLINQNAQAINARLTETQIDTLLNGKNYVNQTTLNATANGLRTDITQVSTDLNNMEIGGKNIIINSEAISKQFGFHGGVSGSVDPYNAYSIWGFTEAYKVTLSGGSSSIKYLFTSADKTSEPMVFGTYYTYSIYLKNTGANSFYITMNGIIGSSGITVNPGESGRYSFVGTRRADYNWFQAHIRQDNHLPIEFIIGRHSLEKGTKATDWTPAPEDMATLEKVVSLEANINGLQTTVANKAEQSQVTQLAGQVSSKVESATYNSKMTQLDSAINLRVTSGQVTEAILKDKTIIDTRNTNESPAWYNSNYPRRSVVEFKTRSVMNIPGSSTFVQLTTESPWVGSSGGEIVQTAKSSDGTFQRSSKGGLSSWGDWEKIIEAGELLSQINVQSGRILIQSNKLYLDASSVVFSGSAFIPSAAITSLSADKVNTGTLNAANVNIINLNANAITSGTIDGANSDWNLNTGIMNFRDPSTGDNLKFAQGRIEFQNGAQGRQLLYNAEGLMLRPFSTNTGTSRNTSLHLIGGATGSFQYIQFIEGGSSSITQRLEAEGGNMRALVGPNGEFQVKKYNTLALADVNANAYKTYDAGGDQLTIIKNEIKTPRYGAKNIYLTPQGTGIVKIADTATGSFYNIQASTFLNSSSRKLKTNIMAYNGSALAEICQLQVVTYNLKKDLADGVNNPQIGFIAEDSPSIASVDGQSIDMYKLGALNARSIQELSIKTDDHESKIKYMQREIQSLKEEIQQLKGAA